MSFPPAPEGTSIVHNDMPIDSASAQGDLEWIHYHRLFPIATAADIHWTSFGQLWIEVDCTLNRILVSQLHSSILRNLYQGRSFHLSVPGESIHGQLLLVGKHWSQRKEKSPYLYLRNRWRPYSCFTYCFRKRHVTHDWRPSCKEA